MNREEVDRIKEVYIERYKTIDMNYYSYLNTQNLFLYQQRERYIIKILNKYNITDLRNKYVLEVGCGTGLILLNFLQYGAEADKLYGIELLELNVTISKNINPLFNILCSSAEKIDYNDNSFDIVLQFTMFTSILDIEIKKRISSEMLRVLKEDGIILWYDFRYDNPKNPNVKKINKREIKELFPNCYLKFYTLTLLPPLARKLSKFSNILCELLSKIPFLNSHYFVVIRKNKNSPYKDSNNNH